MTGCFVKFAVGCGFLLLCGSSSAFDVNLGGANDVLQRSVQSGRRENSAMDAEYKAREAEKRANSEGSMGGTINCNSINNDYPLYQYCDTGSCSGFSNYNLYRLCKDNAIDAMAGNYGIYSYLKNADLGAFAGKDIGIYHAAKKASGSFTSRKRFVIYYLRGYTFR